MIRNERALKRKEKMFECRFIDIKLNDVDFDMVKEIVDSNLERRGYICMNDVRTVMLATEDPELKQAINSSLLSIADGMPLVWYCRLAGCRNIERITGASMLQRFLETTDNRYIHFLLGDTSERIQAVMEKARRSNPIISVKGYSPPFKKVFSDLDNGIIIEKIHEANPDLIWVSLGGGKQEKWMLGHYLRLEKGIMVGVGAAFRFYTGELITPPKVIQSMGLQWIWRVTQDWSTLMSQRQTPKNFFRKRIAFLRYFPVELYNTRKNRIR